MFEVLTELLRTKQFNKKKHNDTIRDIISIESTVGFYLIVTETLSFILSSFVSSTILKPI